MKFITWNVNSIRARYERVLALLDRHKPDVLCLQELKVADDAFPADGIRERGYHGTVFGQKTYNGVAILARTPPGDPRRGFDGNPIPEQARVLTARVDGVSIVNVYVVNGQAVGTDKYELKLDWLDRLAQWVARTFDPQEPVLMAGDFNIAPDDRDVYNPKAWEGQCLCSEPERQRLRALLDWGFADLLRRYTDSGGVYSWWDYRHGAFHRGMGLRIDLVLGTAPVAARLLSVEIDRDERKPSSGAGKPSDHAPVIATFSAG